MHTLTRIVLSRRRPVALIWLSLAVADDLALTRLRANHPDLCTPTDKCQQAVSPHRTSDIRVIISAHQTRTEKR